MAQRKRARAHEDEDEDEDDVEVEIESANSSFQQTHHNKRARVVRATQHEGSDAHTEEEDHEDLVADSNVRRVAGDLSILDDTSDNESESEPIDELQATQIVKQQMSMVGENLASEQGVIMEIHIRNFMCHSNVRVPFGPLINFITGANGSGKSAILTALQVCLGTKAKSTNRAANLSSMVKTGEESASLAVKIKNEGEDAFKPSIYGSSILVERHFTRSGTSSFKIKNDQGRIITTKKKDLDEITESFGLQLENPINVLTQDRAREFLSNSTPAEKYKFFIQGTQLQALDGDYNLMQEKLDMVEEVVKIAAGDLDIFKEKAQKAEEQKKRLDRAAAIEDKMRDVERQHAWAQVEEQEKVLEAYQADVRKKEEHIQELQESANEIGDEFEAHDTAYESAKRAIDELKQQSGAKEQERLDAKQAFDSNKEELLKSQAELRNIKSSFTSAKTNVTRLEGELGEEERRLSGTGADEHEERLRELETLKTAAIDAKQARVDHDAALDDREKDKVDAEKAFEHQKSEVGKAKDETQIAERALSATQRDQGDPMAGYDRKMQDVLRAVARETRWRAKPVGPMGRHVRITEPEWTSMLEKTFGGALSSFVVTTKDDQSIMSKILKDCGVGNTISVYLNRAQHPISIENKEPDPALTTAYRILKIDNDAVRNTLILNYAIEQLVLVRDADEAHATMYPSSGRPRNIKAVLTHDSKPGHGRRFDSSRSGGQRSNPIGAWQGSFRMKTDREQQLRVQQSVCNDAKRKEDAAVQELKWFEKELVKARQALELHRRRSQQLKTEMQRAEDHVEAKQTEIDSNMPQTGRLEELKSQISEAKQDVESAKGSLEDSMVAKAVLDQTGKDLKVAMDGFQRELDLHNGRILKEEQRLQRCEEKRTEALYEKNKRLDMVKQANTHLERLQGKVASQEENVQVFLTGASEVCDRVVVEEGATSEILDARMAKLEEQYRREEQEAGGSMEELVAAHRKAQREYEDKKKALKSQKATAMVSPIVSFVVFDAEPRDSQGLKEARRERRRRWGLFRKYITARARSNFQYLLSERQFRGRVLMDHQEKTLNISVEPDVTRTSDSGRQANTLSGGEKSFSQICLLLSIWEAMGSPIRCLDEFDVFMDNVNRDMSIGIMVDAARRSVGRQFILITPNSMDRVPDADDVKKFRYVVLAV